MVPLVFGGVKPCLRGCGFRVPVVFEGENCSTAKVLLAMPTVSGVARAMTVTDAIERERRI
jgi:hypothetical protein